MTNYLDQEKIKAEFPHVFKRYEGTHTVTAVLGVKVNLQKLKPNESVVWGDGKTFHFKITKIDS